MMRRITYIIMFIGLVASGATGQSLELSWSGGPIANGATIDVSLNINAMVEVHVNLHNVSSVAVEAKVRKEDVYIVPGSGDTYCIGGSCYPGTVPVSNGSVVIPPAGTDTTFTGDYYPSGNPGTSMIRYTFFSVTDPNDTVSLFIRYTGAVSVPWLETRKPELSNPYPNPASDRVYFDYKYVGFETPLYLIIRDMTGRLVREVVVPAGSGTLEIDLSGITPGIHFYSLVHAQKVIQTRKLVIKH